MFINERQKMILEADARINGIERIAVWLFDKERDSITSQCIYSLSKNEYLDGLTIHKKDFPIYFKALDRNSIIVAHDAFIDPNTSEFCESYLKPLGITSMLDVPIRTGDGVIGVICHEHVGLKRIWTEEEQMYVLAVADLFALVIETEDKAKIANALLVSEQRFNFALTTLPVIFWTTDTELRITSSRGEGLKKIGFKANSKVGLTLFDLFDTNDEDYLPISAHISALNGLASSFDFNFLDRVFECYIEPVKDSLNQIIGCIGMAKDFTEQRKTERQLKENEEQFRLLAETTNVIPWVIDVKTLKFTYIGPQAEKILGYPIDDWYVGDFWSNHVHPVDQEMAINYFETAHKAIENYEFEYRMIAADGSTIWIHDIETVQKENNKLTSLRGYFIDITARKIAEENVQKLNAELEQRVLQRTAQLLEINKELEKAKITAEQSNIAKELFLSSMSHEIRTPLNSIIGFQQLLKETSLNIDQKEYVESIDFAGRNLLVIINDILDLSKIESGKFGFNEEEVNISDVTNSVIELVNQRAKAKNIKISVSYDSTIPATLFGDATRLSQILLNLIGNAVKFTEQGEIKILVQLLSETEDYALCEFTIEDTGIGIPEDKLVIIFERFSQENNDTTRKYGGTGLGLTISQYLVEMQGGKITAQSEKGKGSVFSFHLQFKKHSDEGILSSIDKQKTLPRNERANKKLNILLTEDIKMNQRLVIKIMEKWGYNLDVAENGKIAVEMVKVKNYDLILMDIQMPEMDGYQATQFIRSLPEENNGKIPIVAMTAYASHAEAEKCINMGMNAYIAKPFNQNHLRQIIEQLTSNK